MRKGDNGPVRPGYNRPAASLEREIEERREWRRKQRLRRLAWFVLLTVFGVVLWMALIYGTP